MLQDFHVTSTSLLLAFEQVPLSMGARLVIWTSSIVGFCMHVNTTIQEYCRSCLFWRKRSTPGAYFDDWAKRGAARAPSITFLLCCS